MAQKKPANKKPGGLPSAQAIVDYLADNPSAGGGKREIGKAFGMVGAAKIALKSRLKEMIDDGLIEKQGKRYVPAGRLPAVLVVNITGRDKDGGLIGEPANWDLPSPAPILEIVQPRQKGITAGVGVKVLARIDREVEPPRAKIMKVLARQKPSDIGIARRAADGSMRVMPIEKRKSEWLVPKQYENAAKDGDLVEISTEKTSKRQIGLARARIEKILGQMDNEYAVTTIALHAHEIPHKFNDEVLDAANACKPIAKLGKREDWRSLPLITIDPADAKDHDDAVHACADESESNKGGHIVSVAIADVAAYVTTGSALDQEALIRGNSVYFPDRVVPMLPERISNDLCSLRELEERPAMAVRMVFDANGNKISHSFHRVLMKSHAKLAYEEAQKAIEGVVSDTAQRVLDNSLQPLWAAYEALKKARDEREPLEINVPERKIWLNDDGTVKKVSVPPRLDAHRLIEEMMIQANVCAAESLERKSQALIYRAHDGPSLSKLESLSDFLKTLDMRIAKGAALRPHHFNGILRQAQGSDNEELVNNVVLRSQSQAVYDTDNVGHFGLNLKRYAHFTSPIRRYADLTVHRALISALGLGADGMTPKQEENLGQIASDISDLERRAMAAERETKDRLISQHLSAQIGAEFSAKIGGVTKSGIFVTLDETGADGFVPIRELGDEYYIFDEARHALIGEHSRQGYQMGDQVSVRLVEAAPIAGALRFEMISDGKTGFGLERSRPSNAKRGKNKGSRSFSRSPSQKRNGKRKTRH